LRRSIRSRRRWRGFWDGRRRNPDTGGAKRKRGPGSPRLSLSRLAGAAQSSR
jgi:hypothetical protein